MAAGGCILFSLLYAAWLGNPMPEPAHSFHGNWLLIRDLFLQNLAVSQAQLLAVFRPEQLFEYKNSVHPYLALFVADIGLMASYGFLLARFLSWAFAHRIGFTNIGLEDGFANLAGRLLFWLIVADALENFATVIAINTDCALVNLLVSVFSVAKFSLFAATITAGIGLRLFKR
jgi:hypothetical protein